MCKIGIITKKEIIREKKNNPEKFIETKDALKLENNDNELFALGLLAKNLENMGIETAIEKNPNVQDENDSAITYLQYVYNGYAQKKNMNFILILEKKEMKKYCRIN